MVTKHQKPRQQGMPGGIVKKEAADRRLQRDARLPEVQARATRVGYKTCCENGKPKVRVCKKCGASIED